MVSLISGVAVLLNTLLLLFLGIFYGDSHSLQQYLLSQLMPFLFISVIAELSQINFLKESLLAESMESKQQALLIFIKQASLLFLCAISIQLVLVLLGEIDFTLESMAFSTSFFFAAIFAYIGTVFITILQMEGRINKPAMAHLFPPGIGAATFFVFRDLEVLAFSYVFSAFLQNVFLYSMFERLDIKLFLPSIRCFFDSNNWLDLAKQTIPLSIASSSIMVLSVFDKFLNRGSIVEYTYAWSVLLAGTTIIFKRDYLHVIVVTASALRHEVFSIVFQALKEKKRFLIFLYCMCLLGFLVVFSFFDDSVWLETAFLLLYFAPIPPFLYMFILLNREVLRRGGVRYSAYTLSCALLANASVVFLFGGDLGRLSTFISVLVLFELQRRWLICGKN